MACSAARGEVPPAPSVSLRDMLVPSPVRDSAAGTILISGQATVADGAPVLVRVTTSLGNSFQTAVTVKQGRFTCRYPGDFPDAPALGPMLLYIDATSADNLDGQDLVEHQAEALLIVSGKGRNAVPDLPLVFTDDFIDARGRKDADSVQWARNRRLVNLFMRGRGARLMLIGRPQFDLANPADYAWFKESATLYDFDYRDRDWSRPLVNRVARGFWQAEWDTWFNPSNDHPWDGNPENRDPQNFRPYTFANDLADILVLYQMLRGVPRSLADNRDALADEVIMNLLAMQHCSTENFALEEATGRRENYTAGAFRYGMFESGEWLTEGTGWFTNPRFRDFVRGGVFNGRSVWGLGESLRSMPAGPHAASIREALPLALRFCLRQGIDRGYTRLTKSGRPVWGIPGEHAYLLLGMLAAAEVAPDLGIPLDDDRPPAPLREVCVDALDALAETALADGTWSHYANVDATNIAALAEGARVLCDHPSAEHWKAAAIRAADVWIALKPLPSERSTPTVLFGHRKEAGMTYYLGKRDHPHMALYVSGLWLHALANLHAVTQMDRYAERAHAILAYYCGDNPLHTRILNELGGVNNRVTDTDNDGIEDELRWNAYPESTAFVQIGLLRLLSPAEK
ncbi:MAG: hypothetical protein ACOY3P_08235 [Planctomycetota bacterium]